MALNDIQLTPALTIDLYKKSLISEDFIHETAPGSSEGLLTVKGGNNQKICLLVHDAEFPALNDADWQFLTGILQACKLSMEDVALVNVARQETVNLQTINAQLLPTTIILFGIDPAEAGFPLQFPLYKIQRYNNQQYLYSLSLATIAANKEEKKKLWMALKELFEL